MTSQLNLHIKLALSTRMDSDRCASRAIETDVDNIESHLVFRLPTARVLPTAPAWWEGAVPLVATSVDDVRSE